MRIKEKHFRMYSDTYGRGLNHSYPSSALGDMHFWKKERFPGSPDGLLSFSSAISTSILPGFFLTYPAWGAFHYALQMALDNMEIGDA